MSKIYHFPEDYQQLLDLAHHAIEAQDYGKAVRLLDRSLALHYEEHVLFYMLEIMSTNLLTDFIEEEVWEHWQKHFPDMKGLVEEPKFLAILALFFSMVKDISPYANFLDRLRVSLAKDPKGKETFTIAYSRLDLHRLMAAELEDLAKSGDYSAFLQSLMENPDLQNKKAGLPTPYFLPNQAQTSLIQGLTTIDDGLKETLLSHLWLSDEIDIVLKIRALLFNGQEYPRQSIDFNYFGHKISIDKDQVTLPGQAAFFQTYVPLIEDYFSQNDPHMLEAYLSLVESFLFLLYPIASIIDQDQNQLDQLVVDFLTNERKLTTHPMVDLAYHYSLSQAFGIEDGIEGAIGQNNGYLTDYLLNQGIFALDNWDEDLTDLALLDDVTDSEADFDFDGMTFDLLDPEDEGWELEDDIDLVLDTLGIDEVDFLGQIAYLRKLSPADQEKVVQSIAPGKRYAQIRQIILEVARSDW